MNFLQPAGPHPTSRPGGLLQALTQASTQQPTTQQHVAFLLALPHSSRSRGMAARQHTTSMKQQRQLRRPHSSSNSSRV
jgi:hypothetical protein